MKAIINIQDEVLGSWHQVTLENTPPFSEGNPLVLVRLDGDLVSPNHPFARDVVRLWLSWSDAFEGTTEKPELCDLGESRL